jgi:DNA end-binding protein Ku
MMKLESFEAEANSNIELREFIPMAKVDPVYFERSYYLGPGEGEEKAYRLLTDAMEKTARTAVAEMVFRDREQLVLIRPAHAALVLQFLFHANEVRDFGTIPKAEGERSQHRILYP